MGVRASHSRQSKSHVFKTINGVSYMFTKDAFVDKSKLYPLVRKVEQGKLQVPAGKTLIHLREDGTIGFGVPGDDVSTPEKEAASGERQAQRERAKAHSEAIASYFA